MTDEDKTRWARAEARRIAVLFVGIPDAVRAALAAETRVALLAAERRAKEECARIAEGDKAAHANCGHEEGYWDGRTDAAIAIRSTLPPTSKTE